MNPSTEWTACIDKGDAAYIRDHQNEPEVWYRKALTLARTFGDRDWRIAVSLSRLARIYTAMSLSKQSAEFAVQALGATDWPVVGLQPAERILLYQALSESSFGIGQVEQAVNLVEQALEAEEQLYGPVHEEVGASLCRLATLYDRLGWYVNAETAIRRLIAITETLFGPNHFRMAEFHESLRNLLRKMGRPDEAAVVHSRFMRHDPNLS